MVSVTGRALINQVLSYITGSTHHFLFQVAFLCLCGKMSPLEQRPKRWETNRGAARHCREQTLRSEPWAASCISLWQQQHSKWQALSGKAFIVIGNTAIPKQQSQMLSHQGRQEVIKQEGYHHGRHSNRETVIRSCCEGLPSSALRSSQELESFS